jgi:hypothetical protein
MIVIAAAMLLAGADTSSLRHDFADCLKQASARAKTQKVEPDGFVAFAKSACAGVEAPFVSALTSANVSHGMAKKAAASDAQSQVGDYYSERLDSYKMDLQPLPPAPPKQPD